MNDTHRLSEKLTDPTQSSWQKYCDFAVGRRGWAAFLLYEGYHFFLAPLPGAVGIILRQMILPFLLGGCGTKVVVGRNVTFRHPHKIFLGEGVLIDENCVLDAKGEGNQGIRIANYAVIGRNTVLSCKGAPPGGSIAIGERTNIAMNCVIHAEERVEIEKNCLFAAFVYLVGGGNHCFNELDRPILEQPSVNKGGIVIEEGVWLGAHVTVLDGVRVGAGSVVGASALVRENVPPYSVAAGVPAKVLRSRKTEGSPR